MGKLHLEAPTSCKPPKKTKFKSKIYTATYQSSTQAYRSLHTCKSAFITHVRCTGVSHSPLQAACSHQWKAPGCTGLHKFLECTFVRVQCTDEDTDCFLNCVLDPHRCTPHGMHGDPCSWLLSLIWTDSLHWAMWNTSASLTGEDGLFTWTYRSVHLC